MTAVDFLIQEIEYFGIDTKFLTNTIEQAKEMEKQQHGKTWDTALDKYEVRAGNYMRAYEDFDDYFAETYESKGSDVTSDFDKPFMDFAKQYVEQLKTKNK